MNLPEFLIAGTAMVLVWATLRAYLVTRDPLHPLVFLGPMFLYVYAIRPYILWDRGVFDTFFNPNQINFVLGFRLVSTTLFVLGCLHKARKTQHQVVGETRLTSAGRERLYSLGTVFGMLGVGAYGYSLYISGGFMQVYSQANALVLSWSGYIGEMQMLAMPGIVFLAIARQGLAVRAQDILLALLFSTPTAMHGLLGARRGPTFLGICTLMLAWYIVTRRRPGVVQILFTVGMLGVLILALVTYRNDIYIGSRMDFQFSKFTDQIFAQKKIEGAEDVIFSCGTLLVADHYGRFNWGTRWLVTYLVRPIPRQWWPNKYADCGFPWMDGGNDVYGFTAGEWLEVCNFAPSAGVGMSYDSGLFFDFSWLSLPLCYVFGMFFAWLWRKQRTEAGIWVLLFVTALGLSVHVPTQETGAFLYRWLIVSVPSYVIWKQVVAQFVVPRRMHPYLAMRSA